MLINDIHVDKPINEDPIPRLDCAAKEVTLMDRNSFKDGKLRVPMHVMFNQVGCMMTRFNKPITGSQAQQHFVQRMVSTIFGYSIPFVFYNALLFPKHFWAAACCDRLSTLGCAPISCYRNGSSRSDGFASLLAIARNLTTHASSSTATDDNFISHLYDIQGNVTCAGVDSRLALRSGFRVCNSSSSGLKVGEGDDSQLTESLDSNQGAMNLAAVSVEHGLDLFLTYTCNQAKHPGICHLYQWKESKVWANNFVFQYTDTKENEIGYNHLPPTMKNDLNKSMEMAYTHVLTRCWLEVRKLWINFIMESTCTKLGRVSIGFFRDEYQECSGNVSHIHGLIKLQKGDLSDQDFVDFLCSLQKNSVADLVSGEEVDEYIEKGLFEDQRDWTTFKADAHEFLSHTCTPRCQVRKGNAGTSDDTECKKIHPVFNSTDPKKDEFQPLPFKFSEHCLSILESIKLYEPPSSGFPNGRFRDDMLMPKRHIGAVHPAARENMSPAMSEHFAFTRSQQNMQVIHGTNGVARYLVKVGRFV